MRTFQRLGIAEAVELVAAPSYSHEISLTGHEAGNDLYNEDEPERLAELYTAAFDWLAAP